jgi:hypothetical protein
MKTAVIPKPRLVETYEVQCSACNEIVEIAVDAVRDGWVKCPTPGCGRILVIRWTALAKVPA